MFDKIMNPLFMLNDLDGKCLAQDRREFAAFLAFTRAYFLDLEIKEPIVVEIGTLDGAQKRFYENFLNARHIGISLPQNESASADIVGDSSDPATVAALKKRLNGRPIDLLFIDGNHTLDIARSDWQTYGALTGHLVAIHDLLGDDGTSGMDSGKLWLEIKASESAKDWTFLTFHHPRAYERTSIWPGHEMGIGLIVKGGRS